MRDIVSLASPESAERYHAPDGAAHEPFYLSECGKTYAGTPCYQIRLSSNIASLQYVVSGSGVLICNERLYTVKAGDAFLLPAGSDQIYYSNEDNDFGRIWINLRGTLVASLPAAYGLAAQVVFRCIDIRAEMEEIVEACRNATDAIAYQNTAARLYLAILQKLVTARGEEQSEGPMERVRYYIDTHITEDLKLSDMAHALGFSPEHLCRRFGRTYGITPHSYILQSRIRMAMVMLSTDTLSLGEISEALSFSDPRHFSAQFLAHVGMRPSVYRRKYGTKEPR